MLWVVSLRNRSIFVSTQQFALRPCAYFQRVLTWQASAARDRQVCAYYHWHLQDSRQKCTAISFADRKRSDAQIFCN